LIIRIAAGVEALNCTVNATEILTPHKNSLQKCHGHVNINHPAASYPWRSSSRNDH